MKALFLDSVHPVLEQRLSGAGYVCVHQYDSVLPALATDLADAGGLVVRARIKINQELLNAAPCLRWVARAGSGTEGIDIEACRARNVVVFNSPEGNSTAVAEHTVGMLLSLLIRLKKADAEMRSGIRLRAENRGIELENLTVGIIGFGVMGRAMARRLIGFGCQVLAYDKYLHGFAQHGVKECGLHDIFTRADVVSFHVPGGPQTRYFFNDEFTMRMLRPFYLINTSRGSVVSNAAVVSGLQNGKILGACFDVLENEADSFEKMHTEDGAYQVLLASDKVLLTPHIAGWTHESHFKLSDVLADKILTAFGPKPL